MARRGHRGGMFADKSRTRSSWQLVKIFWSFLKEYLPQLVSVTLVILLYTAVATYQPIIIQQALDLLLEDPTSSSLIILTILFMIISVFVWIFQSLNTWLTADISTSLIDQIRRRAFDNLVHADMSFHHNNQSGNVTSRVVSDSTEVSNGLTVFANASTQILLILATFGILVSINWIFALISLLAVPVAFVISKIIGTIGRRRMLKTRQGYGEVSGKLAENLAGVSIAKSFNQEERVSNEIRDLNEKNYQYMKSLFSVFILVFPSISMISTLLIFGVLWSGGWLYDQNMITVGNIFLATVMVQRFLRPVIDLSHNYTQLQASLAALDRIIDIFEASPAIEDTPNAKPLQINTGEVSFEAVNFAYDDTPVLQDISFTIKGGSQLALVGHTGAGKTTLTALLMRFYDPKSGHISIDGQDIKEVTLRSLHENLSLVSQEPYLFAATVMENIRYGNHLVTDEDIIDICELIGADEFIEALPEGYNTKLDESGKSLSAGQRQMITIARTMLSDPKILILDEATSRLDAYSESLVQRAQRILFQGRTTLIIAHRLSTIRDVDYIVVLENGEIKEQGSHKELLENDAVYAELYRTYYAHQGLEKIEVVKVENDKKSSDVLSILQRRLSFYQEQGHRFNLRIVGKSSKPLNSNNGDFDRYVDNMCQGMIRMASMKGASSTFDVFVERNNGKVIIEMVHSSLSIPPQMLQMMNNPPPQAPHPSLHELASKIDANLEIISPLPDKDKGVLFKTTLSSD